MKFLLSVAAFIMAVSSSVAQDSKNKGYYITNSGEKINVYFNDSDFFDAANLKYKTSDSDSYQQLNTNNIKEYGIGEDYVFKKFAIQYDNSDTRVGKLTGFKDPMWVDGNVFLNVIAEGEASLYSYKPSNMTLYLYTFGDNDTPKQLVYKKYSPNGVDIYENNFYRQQLYTDLNCNNTDVSSFLNIDYDRYDLIEAITAYNTCKGAETKVYKHKTQGDIAFKFGVYAGVHNGTFSMESGQPRPDFDNPNFIEFTAGAEFALVVPAKTFEFFLRAELEKISTDPVHKYRRGSTQTDITNTYNLDMTNLNWSFGARYNFILAEKHVIYIDAAFLVGVNLSGEFKLVSSADTGITQYSTEYTSDFRNVGSAINFGLGYMFKDKLGAELRYETNRDIVTVNREFLPQISRVGVNLKYRFF